MDLYYCGVVESVQLSVFPYGAQPILCTPDGTMWRRVHYRIAAGKVVDTQAIGPALPLELHSFTFGDYVLSRPGRFGPHSRLIVLPGHRIIAPRWIGELLYHLIMRSQEVRNRELFGYLLRSVMVSVSYLRASGFRRVKAVSPLARKLQEGRI